MTRQLTPREKNFLHRYQQTNFVLNDEIPVEYLVGKAEFRDLVLEVNKNVLIPRIETEHLVDLALERIDKYFSKKEIVNIADVCTGSGCIGISIAKELAKQNRPFHLYFSDISPLALEVAKKNFNLLLPQQTENTTFLVSDLLKNYPKINLDLVVANPPYIPSNRIKTLDSSVKDFEPILALDGGVDGAEIINSLIKELPKVQRKINAIIEVDDTHTIDNVKTNESLKLSFLKDTFGIDRFLSLLFL